MRLVNDRTGEVQYFGTTVEAMETFAASGFNKDLRFVPDRDSDTSEDNYEATNDAMDSLGESVNEFTSTEDNYDDEDEVDTNEAEQAYHLGGDETVPYVPSQEYKDSVNKAIESGELKPYSNSHGNEVTGKGVSQIAVDRIDRHQEALVAMGISHAPPIFAKGTRVRDDGNKRFREFRSSFSDMPEAKEALEALASTVRLEQREDLEVFSSDLLMNDDGGLNIPGEAPIFLEEAGLNALLSKMRAPHTLTGTRSDQLFPSGYRQFLALDPDVRAYVWNKQVVKADKDATINLRTRLNGDGRSVFGVVSPNYAVVDADEIAANLAAGIDFTGAKGKLTYNPATTNVTFDALWMPETITDLAAGDVFKVGMRFRTNDSGKGSINGGGISFRNLCLNLIILDEKYAPTFRIRHMGDVSHVKETMLSHMEALKAGFNVFLQDWGYLNETPINKVELWGQRFETVTDALDYGIQEGEIGKAIADKVLVEALTVGYDFEQGNTLESLVNSLTRGAWEGLLDEVESATLEKEAGVLVPVLAAKAKQVNQMYFQ